MEKIMIILLFIFLFYGCQDNSTEPESNQGITQIYDSNVTNAKILFDDNDKTAFFIYTLKAGHYNPIFKIYENQKDSITTGGYSVEFISNYTDTISYRPKVYSGVVNFMVYNIISWQADSNSITPKETKLLVEAQINFK